MMEIKGIDVSSYQGNIDWETVSDYGMGFAILRITEKGNRTDPTFERNYSGCKKYGIPVGVYKYSYAKTTAQAEGEAAAVLRVLAGRKLDFPVFYDLEWKEQRALGASAVERIAETFLGRIKEAGYPAGIYCNADWYENVLTKKLREYDCWIARYPADDDGWLQERLRPAYGVGWQYSSKARIPGISGNVDRDVFYKNYKTEEEEPMGLWEKTKQLLDAQVGYLEKRSNSNLDSKTGNAGYNNYTKYSRDVNDMGLMGCQGQPWCATYQFWICTQIFGKAKALEIMGSGFYNCNSVKAHAKAKGTWHSSPKQGALVIFRNGAHIGRVIAISGNTIRTNEGNTSSGGLNTVEANGGCVAEKSYTIGNSQIDGYVWIDYGESGEAAPDPTQEAPSNAVKWYGIVNAEELNVRSWAGTENTNIRSYPTIKKGAKVGVCDTIKDKDGDPWYYVQINGDQGEKYGFVSAAYITKQGTSTPDAPAEEGGALSKTPKWTGRVTASILNVRSWAGTNNPVIKSWPKLAKGNLVDVCDTVTAEDGSRWYYVRINGKVYGFVHSAYIAKA